MVYTALLCKSKWYTVRVNNILTGWKYATQFLVRQIRCHCKNLMVDITENEHEGLNYLTDEFFNSESLKTSTT